MSVNENQNQSSEAAEDRVDKWLQTTGLEIARASATGYINGCNETLDGAILLIEQMTAQCPETLVLLGERIIHQLRSRIGDSVLVGDDR